MSALKELANNARRLLADAQLVFEKGSHQTATSLAILALEEVGKFFQVKWASDGDKLASIAERGAKAHREKQATVGSFYAAEVSISALKELIRNAGLSDDEQNVQLILRAIHLPDEMAKQVYEKVIAFVANKMADDEKSRLMRFARLGIVDRIKQQGLYVDIDKDGRLLSSPASITRETAVEWMEHARLAIGRLL